MADRDSLFCADDENYAVFDITLDFAVYMGQVEAVVNDLRSSIT